MAKNRVGWPRHEEWHPLALTPLHYYSAADEKFFFDWLRRIKAVRSYRGRGEVLYVDLAYDRLSFPDVRNLVGLLSRYGYDLSLLEPLLPEAPAAWFQATADVSPGRWPAIMRSKTSGILLVCSAPHFYSVEERNLFHTMIAREGCISEVRWMGGGLSLSLRSRYLPIQAVRLLLGLFLRYKLGNTQQLRVLAHGRNSFLFEEED